MEDQEILNQFKVVEAGSNFLSKNYEKLQNTFGGKFIVIKNNQVITSSDSFGDIRVKPELKNIDNSQVIIQFIPKKGEIILY